MSERVWTRKRILEGPVFKESMAQIFNVLNGIPLALIGGLAVAFRANPPVTVDADLLVAGIDEEGLRKKVKPLERRGWRVFRLRFTHKTKGLPRRGLRVERRDVVSFDADLILAGDDRYLSEVVAKATLEEVQKGFKIPVATAEDLVVMKTLVGREKDIDDVLAIQEAVGDIDNEYIDRKLDELL